MENIDNVETMEPVYDTEIPESIDSTEPTENVHDTENVDNTEHVNLVLDEFEREQERKLAEIRERNLKWLQEHAFSKIPENYSIAEELEKRKLREELDEIKKWFVTNNLECVTNFVTGEWTALSKDWIEYLAERMRKKARQKEILAQLNSKE